MNRNQRHDALTVRQRNRLIEEQEKNAHGMTVREWNRLQHEQPLIIISDKQIAAGCVLVFDARRAWRFMKNPRYACISIKVLYKGTPAFLFRLNVKKNDLPW